jgi:hypothetical protein
MTPYLLRLAPAALLLACAADEKVRISGQVWDSPDAIEALAGVDVTARDLDGAVLSTTTTDATGAFSLQLGVQTTFFLHLEAEGWVPTAFTGMTGLSPARSPDGALFLRHPDAQGELDARFAHCDGSGAGGQVDGEMRLYLGDTTASVDQLPLITTGHARAVDAAGAEVEGCYPLDGQPEGVTDPESTGETGAFVVTGLEPGPARLTLSFELGEALGHADVYPVYIPEGGVAPLAPAWITAP